MVDGLGPRRLAALLQHFGGPEDIWKASEQELLSVAGIPPKVTADLLAKRKVLKPEAEAEKLDRLGITVISADEETYPDRLKTIYDPPRIIYVRGQAEVLKLPMFAIVGARRATHYGLAAAERIASDLARAGLCIVSGMARGIDTAAHRGALGVSKPTVAVLGCGVDVVYPSENKKVMTEIIKNGAVISEFPPGTKPLAGHFPQRNRIISGLAEGVLVIEAAEKSGSLITADFALEHGRDVFALPGQVGNPLNKGAHRLIKQGAGLVEGAGDILEEMGLQVDPSNNSDRNKIIDLTGPEQRVYNVLSDTPMSCANVIDKSGLPVSEVLSNLVFLEIKGLVQQLPGQRYVRWHT